jgi:hypothetical protein
MEILTNSKLNHMIFFLHKTFMGPHSSKETFLLPCNTHVKETRGCQIWYKCIFNQGEDNDLPLQN